MYLILSNFIIMALAVALSLFIGEGIRLKDKTYMGLIGFNKLVLYLCSIAYNLKRVQFRSDVASFNLGLIVSIIMPLCCLCLSFSLMILCYTIHLALYIAVGTVLLYTSFSFTNISKVARETMYKLSEGGLEQARTYLLMQTSYECKNEASIERTLVERIIHVATRAFTPSLFCFLLGGVPLSLTYKVIELCKENLNLNKNDRYFSMVSRFLHYVFLAVPRAINYAFVCLACNFSGQKIVKVNIKPFLKEEAKQTRAIKYAKVPDKRLYTIFSDCTGIELLGSYNYRNTLKARPILGKYSDKRSDDCIESTINITFSFLMIIFIIFGLTFLAMFSIFYLFRIS